MWNFESHICSKDRNSQAHTLHAWQISSQMPVNSASMSFLRLFSSISPSEWLSRGWLLPNQYLTDSSHMSVRGFLDRTNRPSHISREGYFSRYLLWLHNENHATQQGGTEGNCVQWSFPKAVLKPCAGNTLDHQTDGTVSSLWHRLWGR